MSSDIEQIYECSGTFEEYRTRMRVHVRAFNDVYARLAFVRDHELENAPLGSCRIFVLTEEYCIDNVLNVPLIARLAEASPQAELRIASRDAHAKVASHYPGRDGNSRLPTVIFLDRSMRVRGYWSERSNTDHAWMTDFLAHDPIPEIILDDGHPTRALSEWMGRRLASQLPFFETHSWRDARNELSAIAKSASSIVNAGKAISGSVEL